MTKTPQELYKERENRVLDAMRLKVPDRVPIIATAGFFAARYAGITCKEAMYDSKKTEEATLRFLKDFQPDIGENPYMLTYLGAMLEMIGYKCLAWPGHGLDDMSSYQFLEREIMTMDEYDDYLFDPTDFVIRKIWPRIYSALKPFENLPPLSDVVEYIGVNRFAGFANQDMKVALEALVKTGEKADEMLEMAMKFGEKLVELGFPSISGGFAEAPFDYISDFFRGTRGTMLDMFRVPDKLQAMMEKIFPVMLRNGLRAKQLGRPTVFIPLHKGLDGFMSQDQFKTFYWPTLKRLMEGLIAEDIIPNVFWEGDCLSRLEIIGDIPPGKAVYRFEKTDMFKAKEVLGDIVCLQGNVPLSMLVAGTPDDIKEYCKKLIDIVGKDGGFIMSSSTGLDNAKPENVKAMFDFTKEYGVYS
ncbi:uroporphyrinogen decarboxylase family protein [Thermodesulfobacteriota bacterium]